MVGYRTGRNWTPYPAEVTRLLGPPVAADECYTCQYAVVDAAAADAVAAVRAAVGGESPAVLECKFLPGRVCFNVYVAAPPAPWVFRVARALAGVGGVAHRGKAAAHVVSGS